MGDVMLLGVLRMPIGDNPDPLVLRQLVDRARQAADRIESDAAELARLRAAAAENALEHAVKLLCRKHGGLRAAARAVGLSPSYLLRLRDGVKANPSADALRKLGIEKKVRYVLIE